MQQRIIEFMEKAEKAANILRSCRNYPTSDHTRFFVLEMIQKESIFLRFDLEEQRIKNKKGPHLYKHRFDTIDMYLALVRIAYGPNCPF